jgi:hypothetical protein
MSLAQYDQNLHMDHGDFSILKICLWRFFIEKICYGPIPKSLENVDMGLVQ